MLKAKYLFERFYPLVGGVIIAILFNWQYENIREVSTTAKSILTTTSAASGTLLGFFFTVTTIISAIPTRRMRAVRKDKEAYKLFLSYMKLAIWLSILVVTLSIADSFLRPLVQSNDMIKPYNVGVIFMSSWSWGTSIRFAHIFIQALYDKDDIE